MVGPSGSRPWASPDVLVRDWRLKALDAVMASLLYEVGCVRLTVDDVARRMGLAKGGLRLDKRDVDAAVDRVLDRWVEELRVPEDHESESLVMAVCQTLFAPKTVSGIQRSSFPCCLRESPCPRGWPTRWRRIAVEYGLGTNELSLLIGDAVQAIASSPEVRGLLAEGNAEAALDVLRKLIEPQR